MAIEFRFPDVGEGITEGTLLHWLVKEGQSIKADQPLAQMETEKAVVEIPSPASGTVLKLHFKEGEVIKVGSVMTTIGNAGESAPATTSKVMPPQAVIQPMQMQHPEGRGIVSEQHHILATPAIRQLARELNVNLENVTATGTAGRITEEDVRRSGGTKMPGASATPMQPMERVIPKTSLGNYGPEERIPYKGVRKAVGDHMVKSFYTAPHANAFEEVDVTELAKIREKEKMVAEKKGTKLTYLPFIVKACIHALQSHPYLNASLDDEKLEIVLKKHYHMGIAADTPQGLVVVVVKNADQKSILQMAKEMGELSEQARARTIKLEDMRGSSFTITNYGSIGGLWGQPIINHPDVAILGTGRIHEKAMVLDGKIVVRKVLPLSLTFDHRVIDGAEATRFLNDLKADLEDPGLFLVEVA